MRVFSVITVDRASVSSSQWVRHTNANRVMYVHVCDFSCWHSCYPRLLKTLNVHYVAVGRVDIKIEENVATEFPKYIEILRLALVRPGLNRHAYLQSQIGHPPTNINIIHPYKGSIRGCSLQFLCMWFCICLKKCAILISTVNASLQIERLTPGATSDPTVPESDPSRLDLNM